MSLPISIMIERIGDVSKKDAELFSRNIIDKYFSNPIECFFYIKKIDKEWYCEIQEGGVGKAYLPHLLKILNDEDKPNEVYIPSGTRCLKAINHHETGINFVLLNDNEEVNNDLKIKQTSTMTPFQGDSKMFLVISIFSLLISIVVMVVNYSLNKTVDNFYFNNNIDQFSTLHREMNRIESLSDDLYISKLVFKNDSWSTEIKKREVVDNKVSDHFDLFLDTANELKENFDDKKEGDNNEDK